jgi:hypothetical protein
MSDIKNEFEQNKYIIFGSFLSEQYCKAGVDRLFLLESENQLSHDSQCGEGANTIYGDVFFDELLQNIAPVYSNIVEKELIPTYSYARIYRKTSILTEHTDRPACEYSATICLGYSRENWPIKFENSEYLLQPGTAALYKGCEIPHSRDQYLPEDDDSWVCQVFLHYVDANGPYKDEIYDRRDNLGLPAETKIINSDNEHPNPCYYWYFDSALPHQKCNELIGGYSGSNLFETACIGGGEVNKDIRNVDNVRIDLNENITSMLIGYGFLANQNAWNYDIDFCGQIEYLKYSVDGKYVAHLDTMPSVANQFNTKERKLSILVFLNDDFEGGKLFINTGDNKIYPEQKKGDIVIFPSYLTHGVEEVKEGIRHSIVCWIEGPRFK